MSGSLERCPFCDSERLRIVRYNQRGERHLVQCKNCGATGPTAHERIDAVGRWNIRREFKTRGQQ